MEKHGEKKQTKRQKMLLETILQPATLQTESKLGFKIQGFAKNVAEHDHPAASNPTATTEASPLQKCMQESIEVDTEGMHAESEAMKVVEPTVVTEEAAPSVDESP